MNSVTDGLKITSRAAGAAAIIIAVIAGLAELNTGQDKQSAIMVWFFFVLSSGLVIQLANLSKYRDSLLVAVQPALAFAAVQSAGSYLYGITEFSAMEWELSAEAVVRMIVLVGMTTIMIAVVAQAGPLLRSWVQTLFRFSPQRASKIVASLGAIGTVITALVVLYKLVVLQQGASE